MRWVALGLVSLLTIIPRYLPGDLPPLPPLPGLETAAPVTHQAQSTQADSGLHTIDNSMLGDVSDQRGSWFKKRHWLIKGRELQEKAGQYISDLQQLNDVFYSAKASNFDVQLDDFYKNAGIKSGSVDAFIEQFEAFFNPSKSTTTTSTVISVDSSISRKYQEYFANVSSLAQVKSDVSSLADFEHALKERTKAYEQYLQEALAKQNEIDKVIKEMFSMLNHERAREAYYKIDGLVAHIKAIKDFLKDQLATDYEKLLDTGNAQINDLNKTLDNLRNACDAIKRESQAKDQAAQLVSDDNADAQQAETQNDESDGAMDNALQPRPGFIEQLVFRVAKFSYAIFDFIKLFIGL